MKKYKTSKYVNVSPEIRVLNADKETRTSIWINGNRLAKQTIYECYWDTWEDAFEYLVISAADRVETCRKNLNNAKEILNKVMLLQPPDSNGDI